MITQNLYHLLRNVGDGKDKSLHLSFDGRNISLAVMSAQNIWDTFRVTICYTFVTHLLHAVHAQDFVSRLGKGTMLTASLRRSAFSWPGNLVLYIYYHYSQIFSWPGNLFFILNRLIL